MHEYWGYCDSCNRAYPCASSGVPGSLPTDFRCVRCGAAPSHVEIRLDAPTGYAAMAGDPTLSSSSRTPGR